jgi:glucosyl-3-phosphoglycerate synthase
VLDEVSNVATLAALAADALAAHHVGRAVVLDGGSTDGTPAAARDAGLEVVDAAGLEPGAGPVRGKGDAVARLIRTLEAPILVLLDGDVVGLGADSVAALVGALEARPTAVLAKGVCRRRVPDGPAVLRPGRVSELLARPALARLAPDLAALADPLSGQVALRPDAVRDLELHAGYGLELSMLLGVRARFGASAIAEVWLDPIDHRHKDVEELAPVARDVMDVVLDWARRAEVGA